MPTPNQQRRRALELLEASIDGCTEAIMLAYGFKTELVVQLVNAGLATATIEHMAVGGRRVKVIRMRITAAGRRAPSKLRWAVSFGAEQQAGNAAIARFLLTEPGGKCGVDQSVTTRARQDRVVASPDPTAGRGASGHSGAGDHHALPYLCLGRYPRHARDFISHRRYSQLATQKYLPMQP